MTPTEPEGAGASSLSSLTVEVSQLPVTIKVTLWTVCVFFKLLHQLTLV